MSEEKKNILIRTSPERHQELKVYAAMNNTTLQEYIMSLIKNDLKNKKNKKE